MDDCGNHEVFTSKALAIKEAKTQQKWSDKEQDDMNYTVEVWHIGKVSQDLILRILNNRGYVEYREQVYPI